MKFRGRCIQMRRAHASAARQSAPHMALAITVFTYPSYSLDLSPPDYTLFNKMKDTVKRQHIQSSAEMHAIVCRWPPTHLHIDIPKSSTTWLANGRSALNRQGIICNRCTICFLLINYIPPCDNICVTYVCESDLLYNISRCHLNHCILDD